MNDIISSLKATKEASRMLATISDKAINTVLNALAKKLKDQSAFILKANAEDLARMDSNNPKYDRLLLNAERIKGIAEDLRNVATLKSPIRKILLERTLPNGLRLSKITTPIGVIGIIFEARPNVTIDAFSLCFKSRNACVLKGGSDAASSNGALIACVKEALGEAAIPEDVVYLLPPERESVSAMLHAKGLIDVVIPRGSQKLITFVREEASIPVIETGAGIVHIYVDSSADIKKTTDIIFNAKTRRPSVCNAVDTVIIHQDQLSNLPKIVSPLVGKQVQIFADPQSYQILKVAYPADLLSQAEKEHFGTEFLSLKLSIKTVKDLKEATEHIKRYSSGHSEAIISDDRDIIEKYLECVDAAAVYANASTAFTDGAQFGLGAEIGISTQKLHARGPMGLDELTSYKWIVRGDGQVRMD